MRTVPSDAEEATRIGRAARIGAMGVVGAAVLLLPITAGSQPTPHVESYVPEGSVPIAIEGVVHGIDLRVGVMVVSRVSVRIDAHTRFYSPTGPISMEALCGDPLPGRKVPGFVQGRASLTGTSIGGVVRAAIVYVEPSEDVLIGPGNIVNGHVTVLGREVMLNPDPRMLGRAVNEVGFSIDPSTIPTGSEAVASGYDTGLVFYASELVSDFAQLSPPTQTLVTRAQCSPGGELEVRGFSTHTTGTVTVLDDVTHEVLGTTNVASDGGAAGIFRFRLQDPVTCPARVRLLNSNGSTTVALVEP